MFWLTLGHPKTVKQPDNWMKQGDGHILFPAFQVFIKIQLWWLRVHHLKNKGLIAKAVVNPCHA
jgi:hypothetical protein